VSGDDLLTRPFAVLPVDGVAISTLGDPFGAETVSASDPTAARFDEIQLDLGEGPIWQAARDRAPVLEPRLPSSSAADWPTASVALQEAGVGAVFAFPMRVATLTVGTVGLYGVHPLDLTASDVGRAASLTRVAAGAVLQGALRRAETERPGEWNAGGYARREVHQAVGMIAAQTGGCTEEAMLLLRAAAFGSGRSVRAVAEDVLERRIDFAASDRLDRPGRNGS
jgi:hypothetical protein